MLDYRFIKENLDAVKENIRNRNMVADADIVVALYDQKTALITELQGLQQKRNANAAAMKQKLEEANVPDVSYNGSTESACPNTFIVSSRIDWAPYYVYAISAVQNGEAIDTDWVGTLETGSVLLTEVGGTAPAEGTQARLDEVKAALEAGETHVFDTSTFTVDGKTLDSYQADVDTDEAYTPDTEVISDGYFHESEYRSAPYFDLKIDGIKLLDTKF